MRTTIYLLVVVIFVTACKKKDESPQGTGTDTNNINQGTDSDSDTESGVDTDTGTSSSEEDAGTDSDVEDTGQAEDAGPPLDAAPKMCQGDTDCDDGIYCNGKEICSPNAVNAMPNGCYRPSRPPCGYENKNKKFTKACFEDLKRCDCTIRDMDGDGFDAIECDGGIDCDDNNRAIYPGKTETCDSEGIDDDCDPTNFGNLDSDKDHFVSDACCNLQEDGTQLCGLDCDDNMGGVNPGTPESCNHIDDNCDGKIDEDQVGTFYIDEDGDGHGAQGSKPKEGCFDELEKWSTNSNDCNDKKADIHPGQIEVCDYIDNNCNGYIDEDRVGEPKNYEQHFTCYPDGDNDKYAAQDAVPVHHCEICGEKETKLPPVDAGTIDCDDNNPDINPGVLDMCDYIDNDCDEETDEDEAPRTCYLDQDGDQLGWEPISKNLCKCEDSKDAIYVPNYFDCNDSDANIRSIKPNSCSLNPVTGTDYACIDNQCIITRCPDGFQDCNHDHSDNCEENIRTSLNNCGACGNKCHLTCGEVEGETACDEIVSINAGYEHTCAIRESGKAVCWGSNLDGRLGTNDNEETAVPREVASLTSVTDISSGYYHTCAINKESEGSDIYCWGDNEYYQVGADDSDQDFVHPRRYDFPSLKGALDVATGSKHTCVVTKNKNTRCFGSNKYGQRGTGSTEISSSPDPSWVMSAADVYLEPVEAIAAGKYHNCALTSEHEVYCWGQNGNGQLGVGDTKLADCDGACSSLALYLLQGATAISAGKYHSCAIVQGDTVQCWGELVYYSGHAWVSHIPKEMPQLRGATEIASGVNHVCAIIKGTKVHCLGNNEFFQLGSDNQEDTDVTLDVPQGVSGLTVGGYHSCAKWGDGLIKCWGANDSGQLGTGDRIARSSPEEIKPMQ